MKPSNNAPANRTRRGFLVDQETGAHLAEFEIGDVSRGPRECGPPIEHTIELNCRPIIIGLLGVSEGLAYYRRVVRPQQ